VPDSEVASDAINRHLFEAKAIVAKLFEVLVDGLLDDCLALVALQVLNFNDKKQVAVVRMADCYVWLHPLSELLNSLFAVNFQVQLVEEKAGLPPQIGGVELLNQGKVEHLHREKSDLPLHVESILHSSK
jgi:hypothetical protein